MNPFLIDPLDPLVFGTGKPFSAIPGARLDSTPVPPPSTLAGLVRSTAGRDDKGRFDTRRIPALLQGQVVGPFLVTLPTTGAGQAPELALAQPADALRLRAETPGRDGGRHVIHRLCPLALEEADAVSEAELLPVGLVAPDRSKPPRSPPAWWRGPEVLAWLAGATPEPGAAPRAVSPDWGVTTPKLETRTHVSVGPQGTAREGALFSTQGRRFSGHRDGEACALALYGETSLTLPESFHAVLGGEGRLSSVARTSALLPGDPPDSVLASARAGFVRAYLLTPAALGGSRWAPDWADVVAQASGRPDTVSGWAYSVSADDDADRYPAAGMRRPRPNRDGTPRSWAAPKPTRRMLPAGSVFFLQLHERGEAAAERIQRLWGQSIHSGQDARDGFGRVLFGTWDGRAHPLTLRDDR